MGYPKWVILLAVGLCWIGRLSSPASHQYHVGEPFRKRNVEYRSQFGVVAEGWRADDGDAEGNVIECDDGESRESM